MSEAIFSLTALIVFVSVLLAVYNNNAVIKKYKLKSDKINKNLRIAVITDFHNKRYNYGNSYITDKIRSVKPDIIIIAGDLVDRRKPDIPVAKELLDKLREISRVFYVTGNHETEIGLEQVLSELDCDPVLLDERYEIYRDYSVLGLSDRERDLTSERSDLLGIFEKLPNYKIVVTHRPTEIDDYLKISDYDIDLVITGHTHGGLIRIPFFGALVCPNEGFFPKYSKGKYNVNGTTLIVSGGLGNTGLPLRLNNFPEIVVIDIEN